MISCNCPDPVSESMCDTGWEHQVDSESRKAPRQGSRRIFRTGSGQISRQKKRNPRDPSVNIGPRSGGTCQPTSPNRVATGTVCPG